MILLVCHYKLFCVMSQKKFRNSCQQNLLSLLYIAGSSTLKCNSGNGKVINDFTAHFLFYHYSIKSITGQVGSDTLIF